MVAEAAGAAVSFPLIVLYWIGVADLDFQSLAFMMLLAPVLRVLVVPLWLRVMERVGCRPIATIHGVGAVVGYAILCSAITRPDPAQAKVQLLALSLVLLGVIGFPQLIVSLDWCRQIDHASTARLDRVVVLSTLFGASLGLILGSYAYNGLGWNGPPLVLLILLALATMLLLPASLARRQSKEKECTRRFQTRLRYFLYGPYFLVGIGTAQVALFVPLIFTLGRFLPHEFLRPYAITIRLTRSQNDLEGFISQEQVRPYATNLALTLDKPPRTLKRNLSILMNLLVEKEAWALQASPDKPAQTIPAIHLFSHSTQADRKIVQKQMSRRLIEETFKDLIRPKVLLGVQELLLILSFPCLLACGAIILVRAVYGPTLHYSMVLWALSLAAVGSLYVACGSVLIHLLTGLGLLGIGLSVTALIPVQVGQRLAPVGAYVWLRYSAWKALNIGVAAGILIIVLTPNDPGIALLIFGTCSLSYALLSAFVFRNM